MRPAVKVAQNALVQKPAAARLTPRLSVKMEKAQLLAVSSTPV